MAVDENFKLLSWDGMGYTVGKVSPPLKSVKVKIVKLKIVKVKIVKLKIERKGFYDLQPGQFSGFLNIRLQFAVK